MLKRLQKKPYDERKRILAIGIIITLLIVVPIWLVGFLKATKPLSTETPTESPDFTELKDNFFDTYTEFQEGFEELQNISEGVHEDEEDPTLPHEPGPILTLPLLLDEKATTTQKETE